VITTSTKLVWSIVAYDGNDIVRLGGGGAELISLHAGNDCLILSKIVDPATLTSVVHIEGGVGTDTISFAAFSQALAISLSTPSTYISTGNGIFNFAGFENLIAGSGNDALTGNSLANSLNGGGGSDLLNGLGGNDVLVGGLGDDTFRFNTAPNTAANRDTITDFANVAGNNDAIQIDNLVFAALGAATGPLGVAKFWASLTGTAHDVDDRIAYETDTGKLFYDADGNGAGVAIQFATLSNHPTITAADFAVI
jgi:Ca2+-binding RTX toxin-like protein